jgi:hypothetical protein
LHIAVYEIEDYAERHYDEGHLAVALHQQREDKRALEIVQLEHQEKDYIRQRKTHATAAPHENHHKKHGALHEHPAHFVVDGRTPFVGNHLAVTGINEIKGHKNNNTYKRNHKDEKVELIHKQKNYYSKFGYKGNTNKQEKKEKEQI